MIGASIFHNKTIIAKQSPWQPKRRKRSGLENLVFIGGQNNLADDITGFQLLMGQSNLFQRKHFVDDWLDALGQYRRPDFAADMTGDTGLFHRAARAQGGPG